VRHRTLIAYLLLIFSSPATAIELHLEHGPSTSFMARPEHYQTSTYTGWTVRYGGGFFAELHQGGWVGEAFGRLSALSVGLRSRGRFFAETTLGAVSMHNYDPEQLDGNRQVMFMLGVGARVEDLFVTLRLRHISNASSVTGSSDQRQDERNNAADFVVLSVGVDF